MLMCLYLCLLDKFKLFFVYYRFNISSIRKTVSVYINIFCLFLKCTSLALTQIVQFIWWFFDHVLSMCTLRSLWLKHWAKYIIKLIHHSHVSLRIWTWRWFMVHLLERSLLTPEMSSSNFGIFIFCHLYQSKRWKWRKLKAARTRF